MDDRLWGLAAALWAIRGSDPYPDVSATELGVGCSNGRYKSAVAARALQDAGLDDPRQDPRLDDPIVDPDLMELALGAMACGDYEEAVRLGRLHNDRLNAMVEWKNRAV